MTENRANNIKIRDRDRVVISLIANMSDAELFGLKCYIAGMRTGKEAATEQQETGRGREPVTA